MSVVVVGVVTSFPFTWTWQPLNPSYNFLYLFSYPLLSWFLSFLFLLLLFISSLFFFSFSILFCTSCSSTDWQDKYKRKGEFDLHLSWYWFYSEETGSASFFLKGMNLFSIRFLFFFILFSLSLSFFHHLLLILSIPASLDPQECSLFLDDHPIILSIFSWPFPMHFLKREGV